jgi:hypothetical protein
MQGLCVDEQVAASFASLFHFFTKKTTFAAYEKSLWLADPVFSPQFVGGLQKRI